MNKEIEEKFAQSFVQKDRRDRVMYMLSSGKRWDAMHKMSKCLKEKNMFKISEAVPSHHTVLRILKKAGASSQCYVIAPDNLKIDGTEMPLEAALEAVVGFGPAVISCIHGSLAYFETEQSFGAPDRYILSEKLLS